MQKADGDVGENFFGEVRVHLLRGFHSLRFGFLNNWVDDVSLAARFDLPLEEAIDQLDLIIGDVLGDDLLSSGRHFVDGGDVEVAIDCHCKAAGDGGGGHHEDVGGNAFLGEFEALHDAEAVLLIDDDEAEAVEFDILLQKGVGADGNFD